MSYTVLAGQVVRITNTFYDFDNNPKDPEIVKFRVYDRAYKLIDESTLGEGNKLGTGKYFYDFITPQEPGVKNIVEFYGEIAGNPTFERKVIETTFLR